MLLAIPTKYKHTVAQPEKNEEPLAAEGDFLRTATSASAASSSY
jgi:hypothetical protein